MLSIAIDRVKTRYRMAPAARREQPRVQRIVDEALFRVLEGAIERTGIGADSYICIRDVHAVVSVRLREPDSALANGVGDAIAAAIQRLIDHPSPSVVQYGSRAHALVDLASHAIAGDFSRSWAWSQVGIWRADFPLSADLTANLIVRALAKEPTLATAVTAYLARERADQLSELIARATAKAWRELASAVVVAAAGVSHRTAPAGRASLTSTSASTVRRVVTQSAIARVSIEQFATASGEVRRALASLALLEVEPSMVRGGDIGDLLIAIERAMSVAATSTVRRPQPLTRAARPDGASEPIDRSAGSNDGAVPFAEVASAVGAREPAPNHRRRSPQHPEDDTRPASDEGRRATSGGDSPADGDAGAHSDDAIDAAADERVARGAFGAANAVKDAVHDTVHAIAPDMVPDAVPGVRRLARTGHGGLLYLVNLLPRIGLIEVLCGDERWSDRGLRWVLHRLAMALAEIGPDDAAALVFAGLTPGTTPPSSLQDPPTDLERVALDTLRATVTRALRTTLDGRSQPDADDDLRLMNQVCRRPAQIAAEPGWIEARFAPEEVSLDIRRSGLDRDPDWVPWLGIVLRFVYA
jgi:hypothetical protein